MRGFHLDRGISHAGHIALHSHFHFGTGWRACAIQCHRYCALTRYIASHLCINVTAMVLMTSWFDDTDAYERLCCAVLWCGALCGWVTKDDEGKVVYYSPKASAHAAKSAPIAFALDSSSPPASSLSPPSGASDLEKGKELTLAQIDFSASTLRYSFLFPDVSLQRWAFGNDSPINRIIGILSD